MRSIPLAMTWELLRRGRWWLIGGILAANVIPALVFTGLERDRGFNPHDPSILIMNVVMMQLNMFIFGAAMFGAQGHPSRLYAMPVSNSTIVTGHLLPAMAVMALESIVSTAALNARFGLDWPLWGPAIFLAVAVAAVAAALWLTEKSAWVVFAIAVVGAALGCWFKSRFGPVFSQPNASWTEVTLLEVATMLGIAAAAFIVALIAVDRNRRGDLLPELGIVAWINRMFDPAAEVGSPFQSPGHAQFWFEWRRKGWLMPGIVALVVLGVFFVWLTFSRNPRELYFAPLVGIFVLPVFGFVGGIVIGNTGPTDANPEMGQFLATLPMTTGDMARTILKVAARSTVIAWGIWAVPCFAVYALANDYNAQNAATGHVPWWFALPVAFLGPWIVMAVEAVVRLTGRVRPLAALSVGVLTLFAPFLLGGFVALVGAVVSQKVGDLFLQGIADAGGITFVLLTGWAFSAARRSSLIGWPTVCAAASGWTALAVLLAILFALSSPVPPLPIYFVYVGAFALALMPLAAFSLALAWNRNR